MQPPKQYRAKLEDKQQLNERFMQYDFELVEPNELAFAAGQYVSIKVSDKGERRSYSICSSPAITHGFELLVDHQPAGIGCTYLESLAFGQEIELLAPLGIFTIVPDTDETSLALVATGSGIAPFRSMLFEHLQVRQDTRPITLYWGMRHANQLFWEDEFEELAESFPHFSFHPVISQPEQAWPLCRGRVTDCLTAHEQAASVGYYLCGNATMIGDVTQTVLAKGITEAHIHHEKFY
ncbi:MAG: FAD-binding oxidoreductase [bacterium]|nr:FAD-binding oxidoreductase [bacterium]